MVPCAILDDVMIRNLVVVVFSLHHRLRVDEHTESHSLRGLCGLKSMGILVYVSMCICKRRISNHKTPSGR